MQQLYYLLISLICFFGVSQLCLSNNLVISSAEIIDNQNISFVISWENSWNLSTNQAPFNHDAVWVFVKYKHNNGTWQHLDLSSFSSQHASANPFLVVAQAVDDGKGIFVRRVGSGTTNVLDTEIRLTLQSKLPVGNIALRVFGIEMVYIVEDAFYLGDQSSITTFEDSGNSQHQAYFVANENRILVPDELTTWQNEIPQVSNDIAGDIPADYPKGFAGFYCMKYEISQVQYKDFLNTLAPHQQQSRTANSPMGGIGSLALANNNNSRNGIRLQLPSDGQDPAQYVCDDNIFSPTNSTDDGQHRACNFLNWADATAYLDWAALRPISELEFEKICRGPEMPLRRAYAWGTDLATDANNLQNDGTEDEQSSNFIVNNSGLANFSSTGILGPIRTGFAATANSDRLESGASYYGVMEMSGNLWELCVNVSAEGLLFSRYALGDGSLDGSGSANVSSWPSANGAGYRGGAWNSSLNFPPFNDLAVSDRFYSFLAPNQRRDTSGARGGR